METRFRSFEYGSLLVKSMRREDAIHTLTAHRGEILSWRVEAATTFGDVRTKFAPSDVIRCGRRRHRLKILRRPCRMGDLLRSRGGEAGGVICLTWNPPLRFLLLILERRCVGTKTTRVHRIRSAANLASSQLRHDDIEIMLQKMRITKSRISTKNS